MSFICKACGRQRAGSADVCSVCWDTQAGTAGKLLALFEKHRVDGALVEALNELLGKAQNGPPDGELDGSITAPRWARLARLLQAVQAFNAAIDEAIPTSHEQDR